MRRLPSFSALRAFEAAARLGSFARASEELHLTPSAVSHQVRALERHLGRQLFHRANRQAAPTADGERLLAGLSSAFDAIEATCAELAPPPTTALAVHCTPSFAAKWLGPRLPGFVEAHPGVGIRLSSGADPVDLARHEEIDVLIAYGRPPRGAGLTVESLGPEEIAALCTPELARTAGALDPAALDPVVLDPDALDRLTWLESSFSPVRWADWFALNRLTAPAARRGAAFDRGSLVISAAVQGLGVALESTRFARDELASGYLVRLGDGALASIRQDLHFLCYRTRDRGLGKIRGFREWILGEERGAG